MNPDLIYFYFYILGLLAAFTFAFVVVVTFMALRAKLKGDEFFKTWRFCWGNC